MRLILLLMMVTATTSCTTGSLTRVEARPGLVYGTVRDADTMQPLPGAYVQFSREVRDSFVPTQLTAVTDMNGEYNIHFMPKIKLVLAADFVGYESKWMYLFPRRSDTLRVDWLLVEGEEGEEVIVCGDECE